MLICCNVSTSQNCSVIISKLATADQSTITPTTIIVLLVVLVGVVAQDTNNGGPIENCCDLGFRPSVFSEITNKPKLCRMKNFCSNSH